MIILIIIMMIITIIIMIIIIISAYLLPFSTSMQSIFVAPFPPIKTICKD